MSTHFGHGIDELRWGGVRGPGWAFGCNWPRWKGVARPCALRVVPGCCVLVRWYYSHDETWQGWLTGLSIRILPCIVRVIHQSVCNCIMVFVIFVVRPRPCTLNVPWCSSIWRLRRNATRSWDENRRTAPTEQVCEWTEDDRDVNPNAAQHNVNQVTLSVGFGIQG